MSHMPRSVAVLMLLGGVGALPSSPHAAGAIRHRGGAWLRHSRGHVGAPGRLVGGALALRGGEGAAGAAEQPSGFAAQLYVALKENKSLDPNDHPSSLQWVLAVLLAGYIALGAPLARYIPSLQELVYVAPKEVPLTQAQRERMEREALRKEQEEEFEKAMMEDKVKEAEREAKQAEIDTARREQEEAADAKATAMASYNERIEAAKGRLTAEPAEGVMLRLRCPDGHQLTRRFATDGVVRSLYDYIDVERYNKASKAPDAEDKLLALANFKYNLVCTMPRLALNDVAMTLEQAGIKSSCALMVQPKVDSDE